MPRPRTTEPKPAPLIDPGIPGGFMRASMVNLYQACAHAFELQYIEGLPSLTTAPLMFGTAGHAVLESNNKHKGKTGEDLPEKEIVTQWHDTWSDRHKRIDRWDDDETEEGFRATGEILLTNYRRHVAPALRPVVDADGPVVERAFRCSVKGVPAGGTVDLVARNGGGTPEVRDYKFTGRAHGEGEAAASVQLGLYGHAFGVHRVGYINLVKGTKPRVESTIVDRTEKSIDKTLNVIVSVRDAILKGSFPLADPASWKCSQKYCGVWVHCKQGGGDR